MEKDLKELKRSELESLVLDMEESLYLMENRIERKIKFKKVGRREEILKILNEVGLKGISCGDIGKKLKMKNKNVSSYINYLKNEGNLIGKRSNGNFYLESIEG
jgi:biotin operon repressor